MAAKKVAAKTRGQVYPEGASKPRRIQIAEYPPDCAGELADRVYAEDARPLANRAALVNEKALVPKAVREVQIKFRKRQSGLSAALTKAFHEGKLRALAANG